MSENDSLQAPESGRYANGPNADSEQRASADLARNKKLGGAPDGADNELKTHRRPMPAVYENSLWERFFGKLRDTEVEDVSEPGPVPEK